MIEVRTTAPEETMALGRRLAALLTAGDVVVLSGGLGSGKTCLASGIAEGLGIAERIVSPSFVIVRVYRDGFLELHHADAYRLGTMAEFEDLELVSEAADGVLLVEWGQAVEQWLPPDRLTIDLEVAGDGSRVIRLVQHGSWTRRELEGIVT